MYLYKKLLVALDFSETDFTLIGYAAFLSKVLQLEKIAFIHVNVNVDMPEEVKNEIYGNDQPFKQYLQEQMQLEVDGRFEDVANYSPEYIVGEGSRLSELLFWLKEFDADLVMVGRKLKEKTTGTLLTRISRRAPCSVIIVPDGAEKNLDSILTCTDFSEYAAFTFEKALELVRGLPYGTIYCQHIYAVPSGYHTTGKSFMEVARIMKKHALSRWQEFSAKIPNKDVNIAPIFSLDEAGTPAKLVIEVAQSIQARLIVIGSRGKSFAASIFLGGFAERLVRMETNLPMLIVKKKGERFTVLDALRNL